MVTAIALAGISVIVVGELLVLAGMIMLVQALRIAQKTAKDAKGQVGVKGVIGDTTKLVEAINKLIDKVGIALGVPLAMIILGLVIIAIGATVAGISGL